MLPQSSKKGIGTLWQTTGWYPSHVFVPNYSNTSFVNKNVPLFGKQNVNTCTTWLSIKTLLIKSFWLQLMNLFKILKARHKQMLFSWILVRSLTLSPNQRFLHKLDHYGIRGTTLNWIQNFLTNRTQKVVVEGSSSESARVRSVVAGQQFPRPVLPPGVGAHACYSWLRQCLLPVLYWAGCSPHVGLGLLIF